MRSVILIGYRASGKTTLAKALAERLGLPVYDSDELIEQKTGKTVAEIFAQDGEHAFRDHEENVIADILESGPIVLASGGGAVLRKSTKQRFREKGTVIWLKVSPETVLKRMSQDPLNTQRRPNLTSLPQREEIERLIEQRTPIYSETAHREIDTEQKSTEEILEEIHQCMLLV